MPKDKPDEKKRVRAVTEEIPINDNPPQTSKTETVQKMEVKTSVQTTASPNLLAVEETKNITPEMPGVPKKKGVFWKFLLITLLSAGLVVALAGGVYVYLKGVNKISDEVSEAAPEATATPIEPIPSPTAAPKVDLSTYKVSVLNGSGKIGAAGA